MDGMAAAGQSAAAARPTTKFTRTCSLLRQFIKEKGTLGIDIQMTAPATGTTTSRQHPGVMMEGKRHSGGDTHATSPVFLPDLNGSGSAAVTPSPIPPLAQPQILSSNATGWPPQASHQLTVFYGGKVFVFDNFPQDKARQFMAAAAAARGVASSSSIAIAAGNSNVGNRSCAAAAATAPSSTIAAAGSDINKPAMTTTPGHDAPRPPPHLPILASGSDLPIARRVSLNRFLEKRKDRISSKAPYQVAGSPDPMASKPEQSSTSDYPSPSIGGAGEPSTAASSSKPFLVADQSATTPHPQGSHMPDKILVEGNQPSAAAADDSDEPSSSAIPWLGLAPPTRARD